MSPDEQEALLESWMNAYQDAILRLCVLYLNDMALAEDAFQDTFLKAWRSMRRFQARDGSSVKTWLTRIAINTCKDYKRSAWLRHVDTTHAPEDLPPALQPVTQEQRELFLDVLALPEKYRQVILLYYYQDMTLEETAQTLATSRQAVARRLKKACELLRYQPEGSDEA